MQEEWKSVLGKQQGMYIYATNTNTNTARAKFNFVGQRCPFFFSFQFALSIHNNQILLRY